MIVLYGQNLRQCPAYQSLTSAIAPWACQPLLFVYDNSPEPQTLDAEQIPWKVLYFHNPSNPGVSKAYNEAYKQACSLKCKWLLLADQDTRFSPALFSDYQDAINTFEGVRVFVPVLTDAKGPVSPFLFEGGKGKRLASVANPGMYNFSQLKFINSGLLIATAAFQEAGGYDERFPLDFSDIVFQGRLPAANPGFVVTRSECRHGLSSETRQSTSQLLHRFDSFARSVRLYSELTQNKTLMIRVLLPRALKLFARTLNLKFITTLLSQK